MENSAGRIYMSVHVDRELYFPMGVPKTWPQDRRQDRKDKLQRTSIMYDWATTHDEFCSPDRNVNSDHAGLKLYTAVARNCYQSVCHCAPAYAVWAGDYVFLTHFRPSAITVVHVTPTQRRPYISTNVQTKTLKTHLFRNALGHLAH